MTCERTDRWQHRGPLRILRGNLGCWQLAIELQGCWYLQEHDC